MGSRMDGSCDVLKADRAGQLCGDTSVPVRTDDAPYGPIVRGASRWPRLGGLGRVSGADWSKV